jgi:hypothetical protein
MPTIDQFPHFDVAVTTIALPLLATFIMAAMEGLVETFSFPMRLVKTGWDLCILSAGAASGIFASPAVIKEWGHEAVILSLASFIISILCAVLIMHIRKTPAGQLRKWQGYVSLALGGGALAPTLYFALRL